jgi:integrase
LWSKEDDLLFLKYCPSNRDKCYHVVARDTSCRPHEILKLRIKDIVFKISGNCQYAQVLVNGKTGSRPLPLIDSIPYVKDYLEHGQPHPSNPNAIFICGRGKRIGRTILNTSLAGIYAEYKQIFFQDSYRTQIFRQQKGQKWNLKEKKWEEVIGDGKKAEGTGGWTESQTKKQTETDVERLISKYGHCNIALIQGKISGGKFVLI